MPVEQKAVVLRDQEPESRACTSLYSCQEKPSPVVRGTVYPYTVHTVQLLTLHINWPQFQSHWAITLLWPAFVYNTGDLKLMWVYHFQQVHLEAESAFRECFKASHFSLQSIKSLLSRGTELLQVPVRSTKLKHLVSWQLILLKCLYHHEKKKKICLLCRTGKSVEQRLPPDMNWRCLSNTTMIMPPSGMIIHSRRQLSATSQHWAPLSSIFLFLPDDTDGWQCQDLHRALTNSRSGQGLFLLKCPGDNMSWWSTFSHIIYTSPVSERSRCWCLSRQHYSNSSNHINKTFLIFAYMHFLLITCPTKIRMARAKLRKDCNISVWD